MTNKYYPTKWDGLTKEQSFKLSKQLENKLADFLINECNFKQIIPTRDSIITLAKEKNLILPDLMGIHKSMDEYFIELKCKNRRMIYPDNGIDEDKAKSYLDIENQFNKKVLLVFLDDEKEWINYYPNNKSYFKNDFGECVYYGNWIKTLWEKTPQNCITKTQDLNNKTIICFPLSNMKKIIDIFKEKQTRLSFEPIC